MTITYGGMHCKRWENSPRHVIDNSTTVIAKIKGMPRSLYYDMPCYVTMVHEKSYISMTQCEETRAFEVQNHANYM